MTKDEYVAQHFPAVEPSAQPCGNQIIVQLRTVKKKVGSIILAAETQDFNKHNTQVGRLVACGQIAFRNRESGEVWKEGAWAQLGDVVVVPKWGGFRYEIPIADTDDTAVFCVFNDYEVKMVVASNFEAFDRIL